MGTFASRAGQKLEHALLQLMLSVEKKICADLGCSTGGFTDCLLQRGAKKVFAVDTGYGVLDWKLRKDPRVVVLERTNAMHVHLPEPVECITIDVAWTRQRNILPSARRLLDSNGMVVSLVKPHYEAEQSLLRKGILPESEIPRIIQQVTADAKSAGFALEATVESPIKGAKGNTEVLALFRPLKSPFV